MIQKIKIVKEAFGEGFGKSHGDREIIKFMLSMATPLQKILKSQDKIQGEMDKLQKQLKEVDEQNGRTLHEQLTDLQEQYDTHQKHFKALQDSVTEMVTKHGGGNRLQRFVHWNYTAGNTIASYLSLFIGTGLAVASWPSFWGGSEGGNTPASPTPTATPSATSTSRFTSSTWRV